MSSTLSTRTWAFTLRSLIKPQLHVRNIIRRSHKFTNQKLCKIRINRVRMQAPAYATSSSSAEVLSSQRDNTDSRLKFELKVFTWNEIPNRQIYAKSQVMRLIYSIFNRTMSTKSIRTWWRWRASFGTLKTVLFRIKRRVQGSAISTNQESTSETYF